MNIVLVAINARYTHTNLAIRHLRNVLLARGINPVLREYVINQSPLDIVEDLASLAPDVIMFSVYIWNSIMFEGLVPDVMAIAKGIVAWNSANTSVWTL